MKKVLTTEERAERMRRAAVAIKVAMVLIERTYTFPIAMYGGLVLKRKKTS